MYVVCVTVNVKPDSADKFVACILDNARNTRKEPGNLRFDVLRAEDDASRFMLYEAYRTQADFVKHQQTEHYLRFRSTAGDLMAGPRQAAKFSSLFFGESEG